MEKKQENNLKENKSHRTQQYWYENGQLKQEDNFKEDKLHGTQKCWFDNGKIRQENNFKEGKYNGINTEWDNNNEIISMWKYKEGKPYKGLSKGYYDYDTKQYIYYTDKLLSSFSISEFMKEN